MNRWDEIHERAWHEHKMPRQYENAEGVPREVPNEDELAYNIDRKQRIEEGTNNENHIINEALKREEECQG